MPCRAGQAVVLTLDMPEVAGALPHAGRAAVLYRKTVKVDATFAEAAVSGLVWWDGVASSTTQLSVRELYYVLMIASTASEWDRNLRVSRVLAVRDGMMGCI